MTGDRGTDQKGICHNKVKVYINMPCGYKHHSLKTYRGREGKLELSKLRHDIDVSCQFHAAFNFVPSSHCVEE